MKLKQTQNGEEHLTPAEAGRLIGVHAQTLRDWERAGRIHSRRTPGGHRRYLRSDVEALMAPSDSPALASGDPHDQKAAS